MFSSSIHKCKISSSRAQVVADVTTCVSNVYAAHQVRVRRSMALTVLAHRLLAFYHVAVCVLCVRVRVRACVYMCVYVCVCVCVTGLACRMLAFYRRHCAMRISKTDILL